jgi:hypothetical protein
VSLEGLRLAAAWQGAVLSGEGGTLLLVERLHSHTAPRLALLAPQVEDLAPALAAWSASAPTLTLVGLVPLAGADLPRVLLREARRIGALVGALDLGLPRLGAAPHLVRRLPGRLGAPVPELPALPLTGIQAFELRRYFGDLPTWATASGLWWEGPPPAGREVVATPLPLPTATPFTDALRAALRAAGAGAVDFLPHPGDPRGLQALQTLTPTFTALPSPPEGAWVEILGRVATLPAPPHFCARC